MLTVVENPHGFHLVNVLLKEQKWTNQYHIDHILPAIAALRHPRDRRKLVVVAHADNAKPHVAKRVKQYRDEVTPRSAPHAPYSQDLVPRDFFSSAMEKECSKEHNFRLQKTFFKRWFKF
jgi:hypothetical protein